MKIQIQMTLEHESQQITQSIFCMERKSLTPGNIGLQISESKCILSGIQEALIPWQLQAFKQQVSHCLKCGKRCTTKGHHTLKYRTLFGNMTLKSPRLKQCSCQTSRKATFSPLSKLLQSRTSPELDYLESKWASTVSYGMTSKLLEDILPVKTHGSSVLNNVKKVAEKLESELGEEQYTFIEGCPRDWGNLPIPDSPLEVALDGGYIHAREGNNRKAGWFETIVGKSLQEEKPSKRFGFVTGHDQKPKRRLHTLLMDQNLAMNQEITFITDGGESIRELPYYLSPQSEHILDWFHVTMRFTVLQQMVKKKGLTDCPNFSEELDRAKWYLWHGNVFKSLDLIEGIEFDIGHYCEEPSESRLYKIWKGIDELYQYISANEPFIPNYGERYRNKESISSSFAESTVNELITKRMGKKQQMRWTKKGAHLLLQLRVKNLNNELRPAFEKWYPEIKSQELGAQNPYLKP